MRHWECSNKTRYEFRSGARSGYQDSKSDWHNRVINEDNLEQKVSLVLYGARVATMYSSKEELVC